MLALLLGCSFNDKYKFRYSKLEGIILDLKQVYFDMKEVDESVDNFKKWDDNKHEFLSTLEEIQYKIDALPPTEKEPTSKNTEEVDKFNIEWSAAREMLTKVQDIQDLLYYANVAENYTYFQAVIEDPALEERLENLLERSKERGLRIPLPKEHQNLELPATSEEANIEIEFSDIGND